jgi:DNA-directed RNA polymerase subunit alpha
MKKIKTSPYLPESFEVEQVSEREAKITAFPFESGFAVSLAHPLRRFLLSSSTGFAPVGVKVEGASHEFDSIRGMLEDISEFIINLKAIRFKMKSDEEFVEVSYTFTGPMEIKGSDLNSEEVEILTEDVTLATLNSDATLNFSLLVYRGIGYVPSEDIREELPEGYIALDAHFTPVQKAVYTIDKVLVEDNPDFEKIIMTIVTDGQISPVEAFNDALGVMHAQMKVFNQNFEAASVTVVES